MSDSSKKLVTHLSVTRNPEKKLPGLGGCGFLSWVRLSWGWLCGTAMAPLPSRSWGGDGQAQGVFPPETVAELGRAASCLALPLSHVGRQQPGPGRAGDERERSCAPSLQLTAESVSGKACPAGLLPERSRCALCGVQSESSGSPFDFITVLAACPGQCGDCDIAI